MRRSIKTRRFILYTFRQELLPQKTGENGKIFRLTASRQSAQCNRIFSEKGKIQEEGGELKMPVEVKLRKGEAMEKALRRLKKKLDREGVIRDIRQKRYFEKPSEIKRRKNKVAAFNNMLRQRYENR